MNPSAARFDVRKLEWLNAHYMRNLPVEELARLTRPFAEEAGYRDLPEPKLQALCAMFRDRAKTLIQLAANFAPMLKKAADLEYDEKAVAKNLTPQTKEHLSALISVFGDVSDFRSEPINDALKAYVDGHGLKFKDVAPALRTALVGFMGGSHLPDIMEFLGKEESLDRLKRAITLTVA